MGEAVGVAVGSVGATVGEATGVVSAGVASELDDELEQAARAAIDIAAIKTTADRGLAMGSLLSGGIAFIIPACGLRTSKARAGARLAGSTDRGRESVHGDEGGHPPD